jgi:hypothetical protein
MTRPSIGRLPFTKVQRRLVLTRQTYCGVRSRDVTMGAAKASGAPFPPLAHRAVSSRRR